MHSSTKPSHGYPLTQEFSSGLLWTTPCAWFRIPNAGCHTQVNFHFAQKLNKNCSIVLLAGGRYELTFSARCFLDHGSVCTQRVVWGEGLVLLKTWVEIPPHDPCEDDEAETRRKLLACISQATLDSSVSRTNPARWLAVLCVYAQAGQGW